MHNTYSYEGPMELGSVIAHQCGAVGLFSSKDNPDFIIYVSDIRESGSSPYVQGLFPIEYRQNIRDWYTETIRVIRRLSSYMVYF